MASPPGDGGRYYLIASGSAADGATALPRWSCVWKSAAAPHPALDAGPDGADVVVVQFPEDNTP